MVSVSPAMVTIYFPGQILRKTKTDKTDPIVIATMPFTDESKSYSTVLYQISELKSLASHHYLLILEIKPLLIILIKN